MISRVPEIIALAEESNRRRLTAWVGYLLGLAALGILTYLYLPKVLWMTWFKLRRKWVVVLRKKT